MQRATEHRPAPLVTVAIPTFNRCATLAAAVDRALAQQYPQVEVVVCDNASTDGTAALLATSHHPRLRVIRHAENIGLVGNWNACLAAARGDYFLVLSDDDRLEPTALSDLATALGITDDGSAADHLAFAYGRCLMHLPGQDTPGLSPQGPEHESGLDFQVGVLQGERISYPSATLMRCADARACGGYDTRFAAAIDTGLVFRVACTRPQVACVARPTTHYAMHAANFTSSIPLPTLAATMHELAAVARDGAHRQQALLPLHARRVLDRAAPKAVADTVCERHRQAAIGAGQALATLWQQRAVFRKSSAWSVLLRAVAKIALRARPR